MTTTGSPTRQGAARVWHASGALAATGAYEAGLRVGRWLAWDDAGTPLATTRWRAGALVKTEVDPPRCPAGARATGAPPPLGRALICERREGARQVEHGPFIAWYDDGALLARGAHLDGVEDGPFSMWYANGQRKTAGARRRGVLEGPWRSWHENGVPFIDATYVDGVEEGPWISYWEEGGVAGEGEFHRGREVGAWTFRCPNGQLSHEGSRGPPRREHDLRRWGGGGDGGAVRRRWCPESALSGARVDAAPDAPPDEGGRAQQRMTRSTTGAARERARS